jgi:hypothetical protein
MAPNDAIKAPAREYWIQVSHSVPRHLTLAVRIISMLISRSALLILTIAIAGCNSVAGGNLPPRIEQFIDELKAAPKSNPPATVWRYSYLDRVVYYVTPACCDVPSSLHDKDGKFICSPDGGITGRGDGKCRDFFETRTDESLLWRDSR